MDAATIIFLILIGIIALALVGLVVLRYYTQYKVADRASAAQSYSIKMNANATVASRLKEHGPHKITIDSDQNMTAEPRDMPQASITAQSTTATSNRAVHDDAVDWIDATIANPNPDRKPGQLMTANECQKLGVLGADRTRRAEASKYLCSRYNVQTVSANGGDNGVYYRANGGDLSKLLVELARSTPPYPNQVPAG